MPGLARLDALLDECLSQPLLSPNDLRTPYSKYEFANFVPAPPDLAYIDTVLQQRHSQLVDVSHQLSLVQSAFWKLATLRNRLEDSASLVRRSILTHKALTSPIRQIPPEVLAEIFYHCLPVAPYVAPRDLEGPMLLTQVCRHWRAVAMSTPKLWSSITIHLDRATQGDYRLMCDAWLGRAKSLPLAIRVLNDLDDLQSATRTTVVAWLQLLFSRSHDLWWHGPVLEGMFNKDAPDLIDKGSRDIAHLPEGIITPYLVHLRVTSHRGTAYSVHLPSAVPHLHTVSLQCMNHHLCSLDDISLPWFQLTELSLHFPLLDGAVLLHILSRCTSLRVLTASCLRVDPDQLIALRSFGIGTVRPSTLKRLEMRIIRPGLGVFLDALTMPMLEELDIGFWYRERDCWPHTEFVDFVKRSGSALKVLTLTVRQNIGVTKYLSEYAALVPCLKVVMQ
ncbi:hypothetical protein ID866_10337 [Astraeus odoratus]|nr:hypothetical protein ID866_10337 [Astraeus odoratus]